MGDIRTSRAPADRPDRRIALFKPAGSSASAHPLQLFESMLWALQGTTRSNWITVPSPDSADVIVLHESDRDERVSGWYESGKAVIVIVSKVDLSPAGEDVLVYPFRALQARELLNALDQRLNTQRDQVVSTSEQLVANAKDSDDCWRFLKKLRTLHEVQNGGVWLVGKLQSAKVLWVRGDCREYAIDPETLQALRAGTLDLNAIQLQSAPALGAHCVVRPAEELLWFSGYYSGPILAPWLSATERYGVTHWPNFGLIRPHASQIRMAALLATATLSVEKLVTRAHVTMEDAVRTLNALSACGLLETAPSEERAKNTVLPHVVGLKSLLRLMRKHFAFGGAT
jgi:hypothetical protein